MSPLITLVGKLAAGVRQQLVGCPCRYKANNIFQQEYDILHRSLKALGFTKQFCKVTKLEVFHGKYTRKYHPRIVTSSGKQEWVHHSNSKAIPINEYVGMAVKRLSKQIMLNAVMA
ncbi:hypothetical protein AJ78_08163 [Emergomyces pasteurianus Ep9510]|uniref:Uncharacterized protein n=1 Tax=Emergomyces pasteurianus Ep9510 TaxID=1447872 RepID=A0A1J9PSY1_9EURO|nr:hypothetical protein AJ78_08163 [Emergomyces pasteurianus Ep9510]